ncbi:MAG: flippase-like domain-containing protein [Deltaproteobacteria bacterium]|nr:flippase-like domain-containing protein [Deltaproteobacteria bacterium]
MSRKVKRAGRWIATIGATAILVYLVWRANPSALLTQLAAAEWWPLLLALLLNFLQVWLKAQRLRTLLQPVQDIPLGRLYRYTMIGYAGNNVLPMRGGDVMRLALLRQRESVPVGAFVGAFSAERLLDGASVVCVAAVLPLLAPLPGPARAGLAILVGITVLGYVALLLIAARWGRAPEGAGRVRRFIADLARGGRALRKPAPLASCMGTSLGAIACEALIVVLVMRGLGLPLVAAAAPLVILFVNLALVAPNAPGNLGAFEAGAALAVTLCGVSSTGAMAFALAYHAVHLVPLTLVGAIAYATMPGRGERSVSLVPTPAVETDR